MNKKLSHILGIKMPRSKSSSNFKASTLPTPVTRNPSNHVTRIENTSRIEVEPPTLGQSLKQGFGFGAGSAIAHRIFGPSPVIQSVNASSDKKVTIPCENERHAFETCIKTKSIDDYCSSEQISYSHCLKLSNNVQ